MKHSRVIGGAATVVVILLSAACSTSASPPAPPSPVSPAPPASAAADPTGKVGAPAPDSAPRPSLPPVPPGTEDATFTLALAKKNITVTDDPGGATGYGRLICAHLEADEPPLALLDEIRTTAGLSDHDAGFVLGAATRVYCPQDLPKLPT